VAEVTTTAGVGDGTSARAHFPVTVGQS
jgi:hypothetical protein